MIHVDTNVIIDILNNRAAFVAKSMAALANIPHGRAVIGPLVYAELAGGFATRDALNGAIAPFNFQRAEMSDDALFYAAQAYRRYLERGGTRASILPDFFIGAHAASMGAALLTRDPRRYRTAFPDLILIEP